MQFAENELREIAVLFSRGRQRTLVGPEATKLGFLGCLEGATHVHLACHGEYSVEDPRGSGVLLAGDERLTVREIAKGALFSSARLVFASACETALSDFINMPDEALGLPGALLQAGAVAVIGTLWAVDDLSTALIATRFYQFHVGDEGEKRPPAEALRQAVLWLRDATVDEISAAIERQAQGCNLSPELVHWLREWKAVDAGRNKLRPYASSPASWAAFVTVGSAN